MSVLALLASIKKELRSYRHCWLNSSAVNDVGQFTFI